MDLFQRLLSETIRPPQLRITDCFFGERNKLLFTRFQRDRNPKLLSIISSNRRSFLDLIRYILQFDRGFQISRFLFACTWNPDTGHFCYHIRMLHPDIFGNSNGNFIPNTRIAVAYRLNPIPARRILHGTIAGNLSVSTLSSIRVADMIGRKDQNSQHIRFRPFQVRSNVIRLPQEHTFVRRGIYALAVQVNFGFIINATEIQPRVLPGL